MSLLDDLRNGFDNRQTAKGFTLAVEQRPDGSAVVLRLVAGERRPMVRVSKLADGVSLWWIGRGERGHANMPSAMAAIEQAADAW